MPEVRPFCGMRFSWERVEVVEVVTPPYDVGDEKEWRRLYKKPVTVAKLLVPIGDESKYKRAKFWLERWLLEGTLTMDGKPSLYLYRQEFEHKGRRLERWGVLCLVELRSSYEEGIFPHEQTYPGPIEDRLRLIRACRAHFEPVFMLYHDPEGELLPRPDGQPLYDFATGDGMRHTVWRVSDPEVVASFCQGMSERTFLIADGHHRYEAALRLKHGGDGPGFVLSYLVRAEDPGLVILPLHRIVKGGNLPLLEVLSALERAGFKPEKAEFRDVPKGHLGLKVGEESFLVRIPEVGRLGAFLEGEPEPLKTLEVTALHKAVLGGLLGGPEEVDYEPLEERTRKAASEGNTVFFLPPVSVEEIERAAQAGLKMHPKTTYFHPKPLSGLVMWKFG